MYCTRPVHLYYTQTRATHDDASTQAQCLSLSHRHEEGRWLATVVGVWAAARRPTNRASVAVCVGSIIGTLRTSSAAGTISVESSGTAHSASLTAVIASTSPVVIHQTSTTVWWAIFRFLFFHVQYCTIFVVF